MTAEPATPYKLLTYAEAADFLGVSDRTIWTLCATGALPVVRIGRSVRIDYSDLVAFIERSKSPASSVEGGQPR